MSIFLYGALQLYVSDMQFGLTPIASAGPPIPQAPLMYEICHTNWAGLTIVDFALFSILAYQDSEQIQQDLDVWFNADISDPLARWNISAEYVDRAAVQFYEFHNPSLDISVVSVRGTQTLLDTVQDMDLWLSVAILQFTDVFLPSLTVWPSQLSQHLVLFSSVTYWVSPQNRFFYQPLLEHVGQIKSGTVYLTGHSLGGGLSKIASALYNKTSVTFSAPGIDISRLKFEIPAEKDLSLGSVNVEPQSDIVPLVDYQTGVRQKIPCNVTPLHCHSITLTAKVLSHSCGDPLGRTSIGEDKRQHG